MKIKLPGQPFEYVTENSGECSPDTAFVLTSQNAKYLDDAKSHQPHSIIKAEDIAELFGVNRIKIIGITGTNGKTTTASAIYSFLLDLGYKAAMQGTRGFFMNDEVIEGKSLTTPSVLNIYKHIYQAVMAGCEYFIMEVSSHAIVQERIQGIPFALKILTNITQDHLDYHETLEEYTRVKNSFFQDDGVKLINKDDEALMRREKDDYLEWKAIHAINRYFKPVSYEMAKALYMELEEKALKGAKGDTNAQSSEVQEQKDL